MLPHVTATRYVTPLREGGSLPGLMEADDLGTYVVKFRGAGQGPRVLVAEVISAGIARVLGLPVPDLVTVDLDAAMAPAEPDQEVQDLLRASAGLNLGIDYLPGALDFDPRAFPVDPTIAGRVLWFDAFVGNMDRTRRNPNLLQWHGLWLIDHGATLTFHHRWDTAGTYDARPYDVAEHVLVGLEPDVAGADALFGGMLDARVFTDVVSDVPAEWLVGSTEADEPDEIRGAYVERLSARLAARDAWVTLLVETPLTAGGVR